MLYYHRNAKIDVIWSESFVDLSDLVNPVKQRLVQDEMFFEFNDTAYINYEIVHNSYTFLNGTQLNFYR